MAHGHRCLYCGAEWVCGEDCPYAGPSACAPCRERLLRTPGAPRRVIPLRAGSAVLDGLVEHTAERLRQRLRADRA